MCLEVSKLATADEDARRVYANLLVIHSDILFHLSSVILMHRRRYLDVRRIEVGVRLPEPVLEEIRRSGIEIEDGRSRNFLRRRFYLWFQLKLLMHGIYRCLSWRRSWKSPQLFRAYVETTENAHLQNASAAVIFTYPFKTRFRRQLAYWIRSFRERKAFHLMGLPYRFGDRWRILLDWANCDRQVVAIEVEANRKHAGEIAGMGFREVYSDSESEAFGWVLNKTLSQNGVRTINRSHGVGVYGPFLWFDRCEFRNDLQRKYYEPWAMIGESSVESGRYPPAWPTGVSIPARTKQVPRLVLLKGNWESARKYFEAAFELDLAAVLEKVSQKTGARFLVKFHPNTTWLGKLRFCRRFGATEVSQLNGIEQGATIFFNTLSTAGLDLVQSAPVVFARHELQDPRDIFGPQILTSGLDELPELIESLSNPREGDEQPGRQQQ